MKTKTTITTAQIQQWFGGTLPQTLNYADLHRLAPDILPERGLAGEADWDASRGVQPEGYTWVDDYYIGSIRCRGWLRTDLLEDVIPHKPTESAPVAGHTPGPWSFGNQFQPKHALQHAIGIGDGAGNIAQVNAVWPEAHANARLIASAPALLAALQRIESQPSLAGLHDTLHGPTVRQIARAAIALAKGEQA